MIPLDRCVTTAHVDAAARQQMEPTDSDDDAGGSERTALENLCAFERILSRPGMPVGIVALDPSISLLVVRRTRPVALVAVGVEGVRP